MNSDRPGYSYGSYGNGPRTDMPRREVGTRPSMPARSDTPKPGMKD